jgi:hypothetical protein
MEIVVGSRTSAVLSSRQDVALFVGWVEILAVRSRGSRRLASLRWVFVVVCEVGCIPRTFDIRSKHVIFVKGYRSKG